MTELQLSILAISSFCPGLSSQRLMNLLYLGGHRDKFLLYWGGPYSSQVKKDLSLLMAFNFLSKDFRTTTKGLALLELQKPLVDEWRGKIAHLCKVSDRELELNASELYSRINHKPAGWLEEMKPRLRKESV